MAKTRIRVCVIMPALARGGAERVVLTIINTINLNIFDVKLLLIENRGNYVREVRPEIQVDTLNIKRVSKSIIPLVRYLKKENPDVIFSSLSNMNLILTLVQPFIPSKSKIILRETSIPSIHNNHFKLKAIISLLYRWGYNKVDKVICQCQYMKKDLMIHFGVKDSQLSVINNPVDIENIYTKLKDSVSVSRKRETLNLIAVGSIEDLKQYDHLLAALSRVSTKKWTCTILGSGSKLQEMKELSRTLRIEEQVSFFGQVDNPYPFIYDSDALILTSKYEGFPNSVLEAITLGIPVLSYDCPGGIGEIIEHGINGKLIPLNDIDTLAKEISSFKENNFDNDEIAKQAKMKYNSNVFLDKFEKLLLP